MSDRRPENSDQMVEAVQRQMAHAQRSAYVDRREWTDDQWIADARRLMNDIDGAITSLVNGHVMAMLRRLDELTEPEGDCAEDCQRHASCRPQATVPADLLAPPEGLVKVWVEDEEFGEHWQASIRPADLIAAVRRGVESGTIKGEVEWRCKVMDFWTPTDTKEDYDAYMKRLMDPWDEAGEAGHYCAPFRPHREGCGWRLSTPVSGGGSTDDD